MDHVSFETILTYPSNPRGFTVVGIATPRYMVEWCSGNAWKTVGTLENP